MAARTSTSTYVVETNTGNVVEVEAASVAHDAETGAVSFLDAQGAVVASFRAFGAFYAKPAE